jgi:hypothetical protein
LLEKLCRFLAFFYNGEGIQKFDFFSASGSRSAAFTV